MRSLIWRFTSIQLLCSASSSRERGHRLYELKRPAADSLRWPPRSRALEPVTKMRESVVLLSTMRLITRPMFGTNCASSMMTLGNCCVSVRNVFGSARMLRSSSSSPESLMKRWFCTRWSSIVLLPTWRGPRIPSARLRCVPFKMWSSSSRRM